MGFFDKIFGKKQQQESIDQGLQKTREGFLGKISRAIAGKSTVDEEVLDQVEDALVTADIGVETTVKIIDALEARVAKDKYLNTAELNTILKDEIKNLLVSAPQDSSYNNYELPAGHKPHIILVVGVNGVGKTTTIGKLAHNFSLAGKSVLLGAADTFRAAAVDQLTIWSERTNVPIVKKEMGSDPASVAFDTVKSGLAKNADVVLIDTAGRLHNKAHLMDELSKIKKVIQKVIPEAPHEVMLVLDGSTGQNALEQAMHFTAATDVTALTITKLDGTAKGGVVLAIANQFKIPVKFIGVGEKAEDLLVFDKDQFVNGLFQLQ
ncbi:MAG TPA: signal recognition particle-docking protein FtsY [Ferruginibacter sp.]|jgi:fused signal recognition particle receptor|nr:signal recognition particle-docking protein FtsY [Bacteroidota bacterium]MBS1925816.1 signal recognition particle-docking protein FtsY [Bacteroidota bacterium]MCC6693061.1 signal recognition particle-docking protein FtsY [Chitinophagaceae bacterium]HMT96422.1 signal recognition particle-docking protein FtsY [Ferruginibacter sp.]HMU23741.1 signal recognition particle-docking protein FtsY [Ferruginibacter sp.]